MSYREMFAPKEWTSLQFAPLWVFTAVAGADGKVDKKEIAALADILSKAALLRSPLAREVFFSIASDLPNMMVAFHHDSRGIDVGLTHVANLIDAKLSPQDSLEFRKVLFGFGVQVANSSGGWFGGLFGSKISQDEKMALALVAQFLRIDPSQLMS